MDIDLGIGEAALPPDQYELAGRRYRFIVDMGLLCLLLLACLISVSAYRHYASDVRRVDDVLRANGAARAAGRAKKLE